MIDTRFFDKYNGKVILLDGVKIFVDGNCYEVVYDDNRNKLVNVDPFFIAEALRNGNSRIVK